MKNIYFVQVDVSASLGAQNAYLPYTAGILAASAFSSEKVKKEYCLKEFIFLRENIGNVVERLISPSVIAFCNYCWNTEYNKLLAFEVKKKYPDCLIVFGGHNVADSFSMLEKYPFIDILCHGEGEDTIRLLLEALCDNSSLVNVPNISYKDTHGIFCRTETIFQCSLDYPSPYLEGYFEDIIEKHPEITFNAILETSRGCPNQCAYCDWGILKSKVRLFPLDRVKAEIKWMSEHKIAFVWGADANFGLFSRDLEIAQELVTAKETTGYPERMRMNYAKNNEENVFKIVKKFKECEFDRIGATLSFQSMNSVVLKNIGRTNKDFDFYKNLLTKYNEEKMKTYSELILGLPGETYESFTQGVCNLFEIGQHFVFEVYGCILLPNAQMGRDDYIKKYGIETVKTEIIRPHFQNEAFEVPEYNTIVTKTASMSREMWVKSTVFYYIVKALHGNGLLRAFAVYLRYEKNIEYVTFYDGIMDYLEENAELFVSRLYREIKSHAKEQSLGENNRKLMFDKCGDIVWDDHEYFVLNCLDRLDEFYCEFDAYLKKFEIEENIFEDLMKYQKNIMRRPFSHESRINLRYDIHSFLSDVYINKIHGLEKRNLILSMTDTDPVDDWALFGKKVIWYGRMGWASYKDEIVFIENGEGQ